MNVKKRVGIIGATGYVGMELVRLLAGHPGFKLTRLTSQSYEGKLFSDIYPSFRKVADLPLTAFDAQDLADACDYVITALPHGVSARQVPLLLEKGLRVLDHSGDFRYRNQAVYEKAYQLTHPAPQLLQEAVYGLPELYRKAIASARLVANPGCYPTCSLLGLAPALKSTLIETTGIIIDAVSGVSGAGRKADLAFSFCETEASFKAYGVVGHRHTSEIAQEVALLADLGKPVPITFTPHLAPMKRGMLATIYTSLKPGISEADLREAYNRFYQNEPFIRVLPAGQAPETKHTACTNFCDIALFYDTDTGMLKILSAIDNLGKGAAAQAVQALNCMAGIAENEGLTAAGGLM